ncbi:MAG: peptide deformylase [Gammaproteobacteria bacterium]|nr:peptide deformylase [Gammaproteobacteria bacterium]
MAVLNILVYPDPRLREYARPVAKVDDAVRQLVDDMAETMYQAPGIGLAAIQVEVPQRVIVIDISEDKNGLRVFINPEIIRHTGSQETEEGCLSVPGVYAPVSRAESVVVRALDRDGKPFELEAHGLMAVCIQHELDHLDGKVFVDYLSRLKQDRIRKRLKKRGRHAPSMQERRPEAIPL